MDNPCERVVQQNSVMPSAARSWLEFIQSSALKWQLLEVEHIECVGFQVHPIGLWENMGLCSFTLQVLILQWCLAQLKLRYQVHWRQLSGLDLVQDAFGGYFQDFDGQGSFSLT